MLLVAAHGTPSNVFGSNDGVPRLQYLSIRSGDRPIDLSPPFSPGHFVYKATLDFFLGTFAVDAGGANGMEILAIEALQTGFNILPGDSHQVMVGVQSIKNKAKMQYTVVVTRLSGLDVKIKALTIPGVALSPAFNPSRTDYFVRVPAEQDHLNVQFVPWDSGQAFTVAAANVFLQAPPTLPPRTTTPAQPTGNSGRLLQQIPTVSIDSGNHELPAPANDNERLLSNTSRRVFGAGRQLTAASNLAGEMQFSVMERRFPIEVGSSRLLTILVRPANGDPSLSRTYSIKSIRASCPSHRPYYAPDLHACAMTCNEGYFPAALPTSRCEVCSEHCLKCSAWDVCQICEPSVWRLLYFVRPVAGYCQVVQVPWQPILLGLAGCLVCTSIFCCLCCCENCFGGGQRKKVSGGIYRPKSTELEEDSQQSHRLLPRGDQQTYKDMYDE